MRPSLFALLAALGPAAGQPPAKPPDLPPVSPAAARPDTTINGLDGPGFAVAADAGSTLLAAACEQGTVRFWHRDVLMGVRVGDHTSQALEGHRGPVTALAWQTGLRLATAGADRKILLWQMPEGRLLRTLGAGAIVRALTASPAGKVLASAEDATVRLWDADAGKELAKLAGPTDWVLCLAFSPDGTRLAAGGYDGRLRVWEVSSAKKLVDVPARPPPPPKAPEPPPPAIVHALAFSPDGEELAAGCGDERVHLFGAADGKYVRSLAGHTSTVSALAYHPGGTVLVSGSKDRTVRLWNPANGQLLKTLEGHAAWVQGLAVLEQGTRLASVSADRTVRLWDLTPPPK